MNDRVFCQDCFDHISKAQSILRECHDFPSTTQCYARIASQFNILMTEARANRMVILANFAQTMSGYARYLSDKDPAQISQLEQKLLHDGIETGLGCQQGTINDKCMEQNFDHLWPFITKLRAHIESIETLHSI